MIIDQTFTVNAPADRTAAFFFDIDQVSSCMPGVEGVREVEPGQYEATLEVRLGPIRAVFKGSIALDETEAPQRLRASGEGRDRATGSTAKVDFTADLSEDQLGATTVRAVADVTIRGKLSQFGTGVMRAAAGEIVREFAACANAKLSAVPSADESAGVAEAGGKPGSAASQPLGPSTTRKQRGIVGVLLRGLVRGFARLLHRAADSIEASLDGAGVRR